MPIFHVPQILPDMKVIDQAMVCKDKAYLASVKKRIFDGVLWSRDGTLLIRIGTCELDRTKPDCKLSQEALEKLTDDLGKIGISITVITGEVINISDGKIAVYLYATNGGGSGKKQSKISRDIF